MPAPVRLSKSRLVAHRQCPKRLWLQVHRPELAQRTEAVENRLAQGHLVGAAAHTLYPEGRLIGHVTDLAAAVRETQEALAQPGDLTLFEPALRAGPILVRADILIRRERRWRLIEVKASTKVKDYHVTDAAIQAWVARGAGLDVERVELAHVDTRFVYPGGRDYQGLFAYADVTESIAPLQDQIPAWIADAQRDAAGPMPDVAVGPQCTDPYECEFVAFCAPDGAEFPVGLLPNSAKLARALRAEGFADLRDVPPERLQKDVHQRIQRATLRGEAELDAAAAAALAALPWPRWFVDFETVGPAVPLWPGTRPYQKIPMQWSCHRQDADGTVTLLPPYLDRGGGDPRRAFAESLVAAIGTTGPLLVYNAAFEGGVLRQLAEQFPDLAPALTGMAGRLFDLLELARAHYYHPAMMGSWSIKKVLPTIAPDMDYADLDDVRSGDMVEPVYFAMIAPDTPAERRDALAAALLTYCSRDTLGMVRVAQFLAAGGNGPDA
ncbi:MAG: DUF2779 domain-containing protein [Betaproteobacteria bacterium]|nr:DUF2779 domain-containing protein [Betaproteobacteria bacterium]